MLLRYQHTAGPLADNQTGLPVALITLEEGDDNGNPEKEREEICPQAPSTGNKPTRSSVCRAS